MIRVDTDMFADLFHYGHVEFLKQARALGDYLLVGMCAADVVAAHMPRPILTMEERVASVAGRRYVDKVIPDAPWRFEPDWIEKYDIQLVVHGDDYSESGKSITTKSPPRGEFSGYYPMSGISTTEIIARCQASDRVDVP